jgi:hypothetical protein
MLSTTNENAHVSSGAENAEVAVPATNSPLALMVIVDAERPAAESRTAIDSARNTLSLFGKMLRAGRNPFK